MVKFASVSLIVRENGNIYTRRPRIPPKLMTVASTDVVSKDGNTLIRGEQNLEIVVLIIGMITEDLPSPICS